MVTKERENISQENSNKSEEKNNNKLNIILIIVIIMAILLSILSTVIIVESCKLLKTKQETTTNLNEEENKTIIKEKEVSKIYMTDEKENEIITVVKPVEKEIKPVVNSNIENAQETSSEPLLANNYIKGILVVNKKYELPSDYNPGVNQEALEAFNNMKKQAKQEGISLTIVSGYRSYETQAAIFKKNVNLYGEEEANTFSARPGQSEHQTGLAFDINSTKWSFGDTKEAKWLAANCHKYGFIIRYPEGKQDITGYVYEPWHIRHVGVQAATEINELGVCLEEYLGIQ